MGILQNPVISIRNNMGENEVDEGYTLTAGIYYSSMGLLQNPMKVPYTESGHVGL